MNNEAEIYEVDGRWYRVDGLECVEVVIPAGHSMFRIDGGGDLLTKIRNNRHKGDLCASCGVVPRWWDSRFYCKECAEKRGDTTSYDIDGDALLDLFNGNINQLKEFLMKVGC